MILRFYNNSYHSTPWRQFKVPSNILLVKVTLYELIHIKCRTGTGILTQQHNWARIKNKIIIDRHGIFKRTDGIDGGTGRGDTGWFLRRGGTAKVVFVRDAMLTVCVCFSHQTDLPTRRHAALCILLSTKRDTGSVVCISATKRDDGKHVFSRRDWTVYSILDDGARPTAILLMISCHSCYLRRDITTVCVNGRGFCRPDRIGRDDGTNVYDGVTVRSRPVPPLLPILSR